MCAIVFVVFHVADSQLTCQILNQPLQSIEAPYKEHHAANDLQHFQSFERIFTVPAV